MDWKDLNIEIDPSGSPQQKVKCPNCKTLGKEHYNDLCLSVNIYERVFKCHKCGWHGKLDKGKLYKRPQQSEIGTPIKGKWLEWFNKRGISKETTESLGITEKLEFMPQRKEKVQVIQFNYFRNGELVNIKYRDIEKNFKMYKEAELIFYNIDSTINNDSVIITEGEIDTLTFIEAGFNSVISVPNGANDGRQNLEYLSNCEKYFQSIKRVYVATDGDKPGQSLKDELVRRLGKDRCYIVSYPDMCKDANEVLMKKGINEVRRLIEESKRVPIEDVQTVNDVRHIMLNEFRNGKSTGTTTYFTSLDGHFTWKKGDITLVHGIFNYGKSAFVHQLCLIKSIKNGDKWAIFSPEHYPANEFFDDLIRAYVGKGIDKNRYDCCTEKEYIEAMDFIQEHFYYIYPENGSPTPSFINNKFEELIIREGITGGIIDPYNQLDKDMKQYGEQRDDLYISMFLAQEKRFAQIHDFYKIIVSHPRTLSPNGKGGFDRPTAYQLHGGSMWGNKCDNIICYHRPNYQQDRLDPTCEIDIQKIKKQSLVGIPGIITMKYNRKTYRIEEKVIYKDGEIMREGWKSPLDGPYTVPHQFKDEAGF